jgi:biotin carboxylase
MSVESFVRDGKILFTNPTEYYIPGFASIAPADLPEAEMAEILALNAAALSALGLTRGMTHLELYRTSDGPVFGEVAVRPPGGRLMRLIRRAYAFDPWEVVMQLELGLDTPDLPARARGAAGAWMLHPGPGKVVSVRGLAAARRVEGVKKLVCRARAGRVVPPRESTGRDVGWIEVAGRSRDQVAERLQTAHDLIRITLEPGAA